MGRTKKGILIKGLPLYTLGSIDFVILVYFFVVRKIQYYQMNFNSAENLRKNDLWPQAAANWRGAG